MKKLIILVLFALLASGIAFADVTFGGQIEYETGSSLSDDPNYGIYDGDVRFQANIGVDDYNKGTFRIRYRTQAAQGDGGGGSALDRAFITTDVAKAFGLPIGWTSIVGLNDWNFAGIAGNGKWDTLSKVIARSGNNNIYYFDERLWGIKESFVFQDVFTLNAFFSLQGETSSTATPSNSNTAESASRLQDFYIDAVVGLPAGPGKLNIELAYMLWSNANIGTNRPLAYGEGTILVGLGYTGLKSGDVTLDFGAAYYKALDQEVSYDAFGVNAQATFANLYGLYALVGLQGYPENGEGIGPAGSEAIWLHNVRIGAGLKPVDIFGLDLGVLLYTGGDKQQNAAGTDDRPFLNALDISGALYIGKTTLRLGYLHVDKEDVAIDGFNTDAVKKSLYFKATVTY